MSSLLSVVSVFWFMDLSICLSVMHSSVFTECHRRSNNTSSCVIALLWDFKCHLTRYYEVCLSLNTKQVLACVNSMSYKISWPQTLCQTSWTLSLIPVIRTHGNCLTSIMLEQLLLIMSFNFSMSMLYSSSVHGYYLFTAWIYPFLSIYIKASP